MKHLKDAQLSYLEHLARAWTIAFICIVHGIFPWIWEHKASEIINSDPKDFKIK